MLIFGFGLLFHSKRLNNYPAHIHTWAQADWYALSLGFVHNNLNFFTPETFVMNKQFPFDYKKPSQTSITAVDFPVHAYIPALLMKITGNKSPFFYHLYTLLISCFGLLYLYKLTLMLTNNHIKSLFALLFALFSPIFLYYQTSFLPGIPSFSCAIIGLYYYFNFTKFAQQKSYYWALTFITLATLTRTTFLIVLLSVVGSEFLRRILSRQHFRALILPTAMSFMSVMAYYVYNGYLRKKHGSMFLNELRPATGFEEFGEILSQAIETWGTHYLSIYHYIILLFCLLVLIGVLFKVWRPSDLLRKLGLPIVLMLTGYLLFLYFMATQFIHHDYYFIDTFFTPFILLLVLALSIIPPPSGIWLRAIVLVLTLGVFIPTFWYARNILEERTRDNEGDTVTITNKNYQGALKFLDENGVKKVDKILVINELAPNLPFIYMKRKGYALMYTRKPVIKDALTWGARYVVFQNDLFSNYIYKVYPGILNDLKVIASNGSLSLCRIEKNNRPNLKDFMGFIDNKTLLKEEIGFENIEESDFKSFGLSNTIAKTGVYSSLIDTSDEFGLTYKTKDPVVLEAISKKHIVTSFDICFQHLEDIQLVVSLRGENDNLFYTSYSVEGFVNRNAQWKHLDFFFQLPDIKDGKVTELGIYFYNPGKGKAHIDNFSFELF